MKKILQIIILGAVFCAGYKVGDFRLSEIFGVKLKEEVERSKKMLEQAQEIHTNEVENINENYVNKLDEAKEKYAKDTRDLNKSLRDKESTIARLKSIISAGEVKIENAINEKSKLEQNISDLERKVKKNRLISDGDKQQMQNLKSQLDQKKNEIAFLRLEVEDMKEEHNGINCLDTRVPSQLRIVQ